MVAHDTKEVYNSMKRIITVLFATMFAGQVCAENNYDFSVVCNSGQTLFYKITNNNEPFTVAVTYPSNSNESSSIDGGWGNWGGWGTADFYNGFTKPTGDLVIPKTVTYNSKTYSVTGISDDAFYGCDGLKSITIPNTINSIGYSATTNCTNLQYNEYDNGLYLGTADNKYYALIKAKTESITNCVINNSCKIIGGSAFSNCSSLTTISIPNSVTNINTGAFSACSRLNSVSLSNNLSNIGDNAFGRCGALNSITIPNSVTIIGNYAFSDCGNLKTISIPNSVISIGDYIFYGSKNLQYTEYDNALYLGNPENPYVVLVKAKSTDITECGINSKCKFIYEEAFNNCQGLKSVSIPQSVTSINSSAFSNCNSLRIILIPKSVQKIGNSAFYNNYIIICCESESQPSGWIYDEGKKNYWNSNVGNVVWNTIAIDGIIYQVNNNTRNAEIVCSTTTKTEINIPGKITVDNVQYIVSSVGENAFKGCSGLTSITIPNSVTNICSKAFYKCENLVNVNIGNSIKTIGIDAFNGCEKLDFNSYDNAYYLGNEDNPYVVLFVVKRTNIESCEIYNGCNVIYDGAFSDCHNLDSISIPKSVASIGLNAFKNCYNLTKAEFASIEQLCKISFLESDDYNSEWLYSSNPLKYAKQLYINGNEIINLTIPETVSAIGNGAFFHCSNLVTISIPNSLTSIGDHTFDGCSRLLSINIPNTVASIGIDAFNGCDNIVSLSYNTNVIGNIFSGSSIESIVIGNLITNINTSMFDKCNNLSNVVCLAKVPPTMDNDAFPSVDTIYVPSASVSSYKNATYWKRKEILPISNYNITVNSSANGSVNVVGEYFSGSIAIITATANEGFYFVHWNDSNTNNPRVLTINGDLELTATFDSTKNQGNPITAINVDAANAINIYAHDRTIIIENATEEIRVYNAMGALVGRDVARNVCTITVNGTGVYVVKVGNVAKRVMVN